MTRTLTVSQQRAGAYPSIRDALEAATDHVVISIEPGVYAEAVNLSGRRVSLVAAGENGSVTVDARAAAAPTIETVGSRASPRAGARSTGSRPGA